MRRIEMAPLFGLVMLAGCYAADFTQTAPYAASPRNQESVQVLTARPADGDLKEVGIITAQGAGFQGAVARAKAQAAQHGCDAILVLSEAVETGQGVPGSAYGMTRNDLRCSCLIR